MELIVTTTGPVTVLKIDGRLDSGSSKELEDKVMGVVTGGATKVVMDFGGVDYINSSGLRVLLMAFQHLKRGGGMLHLCDIKDYMREVFEISGYNELFPIFPDQAQAVAGFKG
ncbi:Putative anti-sigma factor antagonist BtrV [Fundidesulfovibrio magnetotacticus]|uniref:Anti-sigma factor antagonist n=1 Tax=Fundidesulfovibrio magnetotacticus TaxID=2730080 RepID=A0A6V8LPR2_9BACT|nr:STAS domain-containing protein [Fundidesulfovibrio magnetotacticus]GFK92511.1 Putative anti-sigma factor antagonist BtrV [Fundidesulfovibrio magnetotacticus]